MTNSGLLLCQALSKKPSIFTLIPYNKAREKLMRSGYSISVCASLIVLFMLLMSFSSHAQAGQRPQYGIRPSILAGTWYPRNRQDLAKMVKGFLSHASTPTINGRLTAIIVPHAGYRYSGQVAAFAYRLLESRPYKRVILIGPSHRIAFPGVSVNLQSGYQTPLGTVKVDVAIARKVLEADPGVHFYKDVHAIEHSLEIQLPFLRTVLHNFSIVPILMGTQDFNTCKMLSNVLIRLMSSLKDTLLLASSDLSHYHRYADAKRLDSCFISFVKNMDPEGLYQALRAGKCEACGGGPVISVMLASLALGADRAVILKSANSGDVTGEKDRVVGYMAGAIFTSSDRDPHPQ